MMNHANVMLLAMSTLPRVPGINTYQIQDGQETLFFKSFSQMEPHTKYVSCHLASKKERLARIVILETEKARTDRPENWGGETATSLFSKRIRSYLGASENITLQLEDRLPDKPETMIDASLYQGHLPEIVTVDLENPLFFWNAVKAIREAGQGKDIHLYMDMQGGDRNAVTQMNAIVELLERQKVFVKGRYANDFEPKKPLPLHTIQEVSEEYRTYDLISAMDIFALYGWGDKLDQYFKGSVTENSKESRLISAIKEASQAISRCNGDGFDHAIRSIEELEQEFQNPEAVTELDVVYQDIKENYAPLLGAKYRYVAQIRWCLDKNFLQQALTIFEAKMPYEFVHSGLIYYLEKGEDRKKFFQACEKIYDELPTKEHYQMKDLNHYLIKNYCLDFRNYHFQDPYGLLRFGLGKARKNETVSLLNSYRNLCKMRNQINHAVEESHDPKGFFCYMKGKYPKDPNWSDPKKKDYEKKLRDFLDKWEKLAEQVPETIWEKVDDGC